MLGYIPVTQRVEGYPYGECVRASYAAILGLPIDQIPRFDPAAIGSDDQRERERTWLATRGLRLEEISAPDGEALPPHLLAEIPPVEHLISGLSPRGFGHRCVGIGGRVAWDPHPSRAGLVKIYSVGFLLPLRGAQ